MVYIFQICKVIAKSEESLLLHTLTHHLKTENKMINAKEVSDTTPISKKEDTNKNLNTKCSKKVEKCEDVEVKKGFQGITFVDFTSKKFPLVAKAFCESKTLSEVDSFPMYQCQHCDKQFPVKGAKDLHEASHIPEEYTACPKCNCHFTDSLRLQEHMQKHVSDVKFDEYLCTDQSDDNIMPQNYWLAQFGLIARDDIDKEIGVISMSAENLEKMDDSNSDKSSVKELKIDTDKEDECEVVSPMSAPNIKSEPNTPDDTKLRLTNFFIPSKSGNRESKSFLSLNAPKLSPSSQTVKQASPLAKTPLTDSLSYMKKLESSLTNRVHPPVFQCKHCDVILASPKDLEGNLHLFLLSSSSSYIIYLLYNEKE